MYCCLLEIHVFEMLDTAAADSVSAMSIKPLPDFTPVETWRDDFDSDAGDCATIDYTDRRGANSANTRKFWTTDIGDGTDGPGPGWGNDEMEYYTDDAVTTDGDGCLLITAERTSDANGPAGWQESNRWKYVSGKITTANRVGFEYGLIEARMQIPTEVGSWSAFWLLGESLLAGVSWPQCGEIDVLEAVGQEPASLLGTIHGPGYFGGEGLTRKIDHDGPLSDGFHIYSVLWLPDEIYWMFDGTAYHHLSAADAAPHEWVFNQRFYAILNLAMGGTLGGALSDSVDRAQMRVDYVRHCAVVLAGSDDPIGSVTLH
ncbi:MAG: glycoside hydrolase family 16 protein [Actinomycetes bacterium]